MKMNVVSFEQAKRSGQLREPQVRLPTRTVRASCNILVGTKFSSPDRNCTYPRKAVISRFAQSVLKSVGSYDVASAL